MQKQSKGYNDFFPFEFEHGLIYARLTVKQVAELAHVHPKTAAKWANRSQTPHASTWELVKLKATKRILPDSRQFLAVFINDNGMIEMADGKTFFPNEIYAADWLDVDLRDKKKELERTRLKMAAMATHNLPNF